MPAAAAAARRAPAAGRELTDLRGQPRRRRRVPQLRRQFRARQGRRRRAGTAVPLFFVAEAEIFRDRWYWRDRRVAHASRAGRSSYQPLTSTYRVTTVGGLSQNYPTRDEALAAISRSARWKIAEAGQIDDGHSLPRLPLPARHPRSCRGRCRSASAASPTGSFRSSARSASIEQRPTPRRRRAARPAAARRRRCPRAGRWAWIVSTLAALGAGLVLAFLLGVATNNPALYERHYVWLFWVNVGAGQHAARRCIVVAGVRMLWRVSRGRFGSRLLLKLAAIFALVGIVPGVLIYTVSYQFVSRSIESWFDVKVEGALDRRPQPRPRHDRRDRRPTWRPRRASRPSASARARSPGRAALARAAARAALGAGARAGRQRRPDAARHRLASRRPDARAAVGRSCCARRARSASSARPKGSTKRPRPAPARARACAPSRGASRAATSRSASRSASCVVDAVDRRRSLAANALAVHQRLPRVPAARAGALGPAQDVHRHADAGAGARRVRRAAARDRAQQPAGAAAAAAGRRRARRSRAATSSSKAVFESRDELGGLTRSFAEMTEQLADARELVAPERRPGRRRARQPADDPRQPDRRRDRVRPQRRDRHRQPGRDAHPARCRCRPTAAAGSTRSPALGDFAQAVWQRFELHAGQPRGRRARPLAGLVRAADRAAPPAASATRSRCWCAARRCRRARA